MGTRVLGPLLLPVLYVQGRRVRRTVPLLPEPPGARTGRRGLPPSTNVMNPAADDTAHPDAHPDALPRTTGPALRLLIVGDSAAAGVGAPSQDVALLGQLVDALSAEGPVDWRLEARTGATAAGTRLHLAKLAPQPFDVAVTSLGLNDVTGGRAPADVVADLVAVVELLRTRFGVRHVVVSGIPPVGEFPALPQPLRGYLGRRARAVDEALAAWAATASHVEHLPLDFARDQAAIPSAMASDGFHPGPALYTVWARALADRIAAWRSAGA
jgi:lysophospholipase L1-like esterase